MKSPTVLIDTHILIWHLSGSDRIKSISWIEDFPYLAVSPVGLLEMKFLAECGKIDMEFEKIVKKLKSDPFFTIDDIGLEEICSAAYSLSWTRDPFDRLLVAHSQARNIPLGTCDRLIKQHYSNTL